MTTLFAVNGTAGSGKTTRFAIPHLYNSTHLLNLIVLPTLVLSKDWSSHLTHAGIPHQRAFADDLDNTSVQDYLEQHMPLLERSGAKETIIISHITYRKLNPELVKNWNVYFDELPKLIDSRVITFDNENKESDYFNVDDAGLVTLTPKASNTDKHAGKSKSINELIQILKTDRFVVSRTSYDKKKRQGAYLILPDKNYFIGNVVYVLGADASSFPLLDNAQKNIDMPPHNSNHLSDKIEIIYFTNEDNTKTMREDNPDALDEINKLIIHDVDGEECLYAANKTNPRRIVSSYTEPNLDYAQNFIPIGVLASGLNMYSHIHNCVYMASMNFRTSVHSQLVNLHGLDDDTIYFWQNLYPAYQIIMRGSLRLDEPITKYRIYVMDHKLALYLKLAYFHNAKLRKLGNIKIKPRKIQMDRNVGISDSDRVKIDNIFKNVEELGLNVPNFALLYETSKVSAIEALKTRELWGKLTTRGTWKK